MPIFHAPIRDYLFLLQEYFDLSSLNDITGFKELSPDLIESIVQEGGKFCEEVLFPLNQVGDKHGCTFDNGKVTLAPGFKEAYEAYTQSGWSSFTCDPAFGGQGLPNVINMPMIEMICSANLAFGIIPGLSHGAYNALAVHGDETLKHVVLPKLTSGEWTGVMCLTEPQCGTDLGLITTRAEPQPDGSYRLFGDKIFISAGEHDAVGNIVHMVLAKLPDAPEGVHGISLFLAGKNDLDTNKPNGITCTSMEEKMGIHGTPTCVMHYENAKAYMVGIPHKGLRAMFTMMNEARLYVGVQGLGLAEVAYQNAAQYAKERLQGRSLNGKKYPEKSADPIVVHPDVRRMLLTMRSFVEGARALVLDIALQLDISKHHPDKLVKAAADDYVQLMTPILKAYLTDKGFEAANLAMQVYGGHGYIRESGIEQYSRDARIAQIYEGANGIQALDLVGRKLPRNTGRYLRSFFHPITQFINSHRDTPEMAEFNKPLYQAVTSLQQASLWIAQKGLTNPEDGAAAATDYLTMFGHVALGFHFAKMAELCLNKQKTNPSSFYQAKLATARFFIQKILPQHYGLLATITSGSKSIMEMEESHF
ncbi:MAG: acyl-CoA dehydrogenase C-terminal domain-containing protein [Alphaproteobacteria bacterium]|nr:acyl-CoA dehydrogenase C-terminal domain-containing protein [Alphaproteobacteria bacterium]